MFILLTFIGTLPSYILECIFQIRLYCDNDIYLITNDLESEYLTYIRDTIKIIPYDSVIDPQCTDLFVNNKHKFHYVKELLGREELFIRSLERFFLAHNFLNKYNLSDCLFMEIDNLIYDNPNKWIPMFQQKPLCLMNHADDHLASGICYIRDKHSLTKFIDFVSDSVKNIDGEFISEMILFFKYKNLNYNDILLLPIVFGNSVQSRINPECFENYEMFDGIFDGAAYGSHFLGVETIYRYNPEFITNRYLIQAKYYDFKWDLDADGLRKPYVWNNSEKKWIRINNLHVHSKNLKAGLSKVNI